MPVRIAIVGAGVSGLACGRLLAHQGHQVVIFEQRGAVGGRAATSRVHGCLVDPGAQYLRLPDTLPDLRRLLLEDLPSPGLVDIARPVWPFDRFNRVQPGDPAQNAEPKWTYASGLRTLGRVLGRGLEVRLQTEVRQLERLPKGYRLLGAAARALAEAERVVVAVPAPQALLLLPSGRRRTERVDRALALLASLTYGPMLTFILGYRRPPEGTIFAAGTASDPRPYYALVNADHQHALSWLAVENDRGSTRAPDDVLALVAQMAVPFSERCLAVPARDLLPDVAEQVRALLAVDLGVPLWYACTRWRYARPLQLLDLAELNRAHGGLCFVGDYTAGWRLHLALDAGLRVAPLVLGPAD
jgi:predicted NAD/FAD-dependent oxidoreductase